MSTASLKPRFARFARNDDGNISVEAIIVFPVLFWMFFIGWVYFDAFHQQSINQKANYVIADMISRETDPIDKDYMGNAFTLLKDLTRTNGNGTGFRASVVQYDADANDWNLVWSDAYGSRTPLKNGNMTDYADLLPLGVDAEQLILVETWEQYNPAFDVGLNAFEIATYSFTAPRYAPQIVWQGGPSSGGGQGSGPGTSQNASSYDPRVEHTDAWQRLWSWLGL